MPAHRPPSPDADVRFRALFDLTPIGTFMTTADGVIADVNPAALELLGRPRGELIGARLADLTFPEDVATSQQHLAALVAGATLSYRLRKRYVRGDGQVFWAQLDACLLPGGGDEPVMVLGQVQNIGDRLDREAELEQVATHDALTGLLNRRGLLEELDRSVAQVRRYGRPGALLVMDLDHFKLVNDELGHQAGDVALIAVGALLAGRLRATDVVARHGGDEFAVILPETGRALAERIAQDLLTLVREARVGVSEQPITASIGIALLARDSTAVTALAAADQAMYAAKRTGGDAAQFASD